MEAGLLLHSLPPEERLLLHCARIDAGETVEIAGIDWARFLTLAGRHALVPAAFERLVEEGGTDLPETGATALGRAHRASVERSFLLTSRLTKVLEVLNNASIDALVFKGPVQAICRQRGPGARQFADLDLLVRKEDAAAARTRLLDAGYRPERDLRRGAERAQLRTQCDYKLFGPVPGEAVEIHWDFLPRFFGVAFPLDEMWKRSTSTTVAGREVRVLAPEDDLLVTCAHGAKHHWERLGWVRDLNGLLRTVPTSELPGVRRSAERLGLRRILASALVLAETVEGGAGSGHPSTDRRAEEYASRVLRLMLSDEGPPERGIEAVRLHLLARERPADRARLALRLALTTTQRDWESFPLPDRLFALCPAWRPLRLLGSALAAPRGTSTEGGS